MAHGDWMSDSALSLFYLECMLLASIAPVDELFFCVRLNLSKICD